MRKKNIILSLLLTLCMVLELSPCVFAASKTTVFVDVHDATNSETQIKDRVGFGTPSVVADGIGGKTDEDQYLAITPNAAASRFGIYTEDGTTQWQGSTLRTETEDKPFVYSIDIYPESGVSEILFGTTAGGNLCGGKIQVSDLNANEWNNIKLVYVPGTALATYTFVNGELKLQNSNAGGGPIRFTVNWSNHATGKVFIDNLLVCGLDSFILPDLSCEYIDDGEVKNHYRKTAGDILDATNADNSIEKKIIGADGAEIDRNAYVTEGMKLRADFMVDGESFCHKDYVFAQVDTDADIAKSDITVPTSATENLTLPTTYQVGEHTVTIEWSSNKPQYLSADGVINRPQATDVNVILTAVFDDGLSTRTVQYPVTVVSYGCITEVQTVKVSLSSNTAQIGEDIAYTVRYFDDFGAMDVEYIAVCEDSDLTIDTENKTITSDVAGVYKIVFQAPEYDGFEKSFLVTFNDPEGYSVLSTDEVYSEDFEGEEVDENLLASTITVSEYDGSKMLHFAASGEKTTSLFGPTDSDGNIILLKNYIFEADVFAKNCVNAGTQPNFTVRMRTKSGSGYQFAYHEFLNIPTRTNSVFSSAKASGANTADWTLAKTDVVPEIYSGTASDKRGFDKTYHYKMSVINNEFAAQLLDGDTAIVTQSTKLTDMDSNVNELGSTQLISQGTEVYVDNIKMYEPTLINEIKLVPEKSIIPSSESATSFKVLGRDANDEWIELDESQYTITPIDENVVINGSEIALASEGIYNIAVQAGSLNNAVELTVSASNDEMQSAYESLVIENTDNVKHDITLPTISGCHVIWEIEGDAAVLDDNMVRISRPEVGEEDAEVTLIATIYNGRFMTVKRFPITIKAKISDEDAVAAAKALVKVAATTTSDITLPTSVGDEDVTITWSSSMPSVISTTGVVTRKASNTNVNLTAQYARGDYNEMVTYAVSVSGTGSQSGGNNGGTGGTGGTGGGGGGNGGGGISYTLKPTSPIVQSTPKPETAGPSIKDGSFADVAEDSWYYDAVYALYKQGVINGVSETRFEPQRNITREEFLKILLTALEIDTSDGTRYTDVPADSWYAPYVEGAASCGIVNGISDDVFGTGTPITRQDMCVMTFRALQYKGKAPELEGSYTFADDSAIADYAKESIYALKQYGAVSGIGDDLFAPQNNTTRAQAAVMLQNILQKNM